MTVVWNKVQFIGFVLEVMNVCLFSLPLQIQQGGMLLGAVYVGVSKGT